MNPLAHVNLSGRRPSSLLLCCWTAMSVLGLPVSQTRADIVIDTVLVGNAGNGADTTGFGAVNYEYRIGKHEVTNTQYAEFLNSVDPSGANALLLYSNQMGSNVHGGITRNLSAAVGQRYQVKAGHANTPVIHVSWYDSIRFANWLHNGQGTGSTETGAYTIQGATPTPSNGSQITRNSDARWALASEDEWYKAAYHAADGVTQNYFRYPTRSNTRPYSDQPDGTDTPDPSNTANVYFDDFQNNGYDDGYAVNGSSSFPSTIGLTDVGSYQAALSPYGALDMAGNLVEWNEASLGSDWRGIRGGSFWTGSFALDLDDSQVRFPNVSGGFDDQDIGFRVVQVTAVPEPSTFGCLGLLGAIGLCWVRRRKQHHG